MMFTRETIHQLSCGW